MSQFTTSQCLKFTEQGLVYPPTQAVTQMPLDAVKALHRISDNLYCSIFSHHRRFNSFRRRFTDLDELFQGHRRTLSTFLEREFATPFARIANYHVEYASLIRTVSQYSHLTNPAHPSWCPDSDPMVGDCLVSIMESIGACWDLCRAIVASIEKAQSRVDQLSASFKDDLFWADGIVFLKSRHLGQSWSEDLVRDIFPCMDAVRKSFDPLLEYFKAHEVYLRTLRDEISEELHSNDMAHGLSSISSLHLPTPALTPTPPRDYDEMETNIVSERWSAYGTITRFCVWKDVEGIQSLFRGEFTLSDELEDGSEQGWRSNGVRGVVRRVSSAFGTSSIHVF